MDRTNDGPLCPPCAAGPSGPSYARRQDTRQDLFLFMVGRLPDRPLVAFWSWVTPEGPPTAPLDASGRAPAPTRCQVPAEADRAFLGARP
jgi:hypothetical protein